MKTLLRLSLALSLIAGVALAEEKNGASLVISKTTVDKVEHNSSYSSYSRTEKTQALKATIKNISFKPMPESELNWKIVVVHYSYSTIYSGTEKVRALKPAETQDLVLGGAEVATWRDYSGRGGDKVEYQVVLRQGDSEIVRSQSTPAFDGLAKRASKPYSSGSSSGSGSSGSSR